MSTTSQLDLLSSIGIDPAGGTTPQVTPDILHTEDLHTGGLVVGTPEHTLSIHRTRSNSIAVGTLAPSVAECSLALSRTSHHNQQILKQQSVSQHFGVPVITVCLCIGNFISCRGIYAVSCTTDRTKLSGNQRTEIDGGIEMIDLVVITVIVAPAIPSIVLRSIGAAEMVNTIRLPPLRVDLWPFHHGVAAERSIRNLGCGAVDLLGIVVRIEIVIDNACISQHTRTRHELFARVERPTTTVELAGAEIHSRRSKCRIIHIRRISYSSGGAGSRLDQVIAEQIVSLLRRYAGSVCLAAIIGTGTGVRECGIVIHHSDCHIGIRISAVGGDVLEQFTLSLAGRITGRAPTDNCTCNATRKLRRNFYLNGIRRRDIHRLSGKLLHRLRFINNYTVSLIPIIHTLRGIRECRIVIGSGRRDITIRESCRCFNIGDKIAIEFILRIVSRLPPDNCTLHGAERLVIHDRVVGKCSCNYHASILSNKRSAEYQHIGRLNAAEEVSVFTENQIFFCHFDCSPFALRISYNGTDKFAVGVKSFDGSRHFCPCCAFQHICHGQESIRESLRQCSTIARSRSDGRTII